MNLLVNKVYDKSQIFETVQGEGVHSGVPSFFIRLQGCNVRCFFCDEKSTWKHGGEFASEIEIKEILNFFHEKNPNLKRVVITGGEPTEQNLVPLIKALVNKGFSVAIETAATGEYLQDIFELKHELGSEKLWITFSPKEVYSENGKPFSHKIWELADELKFVFASEKAAKYLLEVIFKELDIVKSKMPVFLVPDWNNKAKYQEEILNILKIYPSRCRIGIQAHKFLGLL